MRTKLTIMAPGLVAILTMVSSQALARSKEFDVRNEHGGHAFGEVRWNFQDITIFGTMEQTVQGKNSFLYMKWTALGKVYNKEIAGVGGGGKHAASHTNFKRHFDFPGAPSEFRVTMCSQVKGEWCCGTPQGPLC